MTDLRTAAQQALELCDRINNDREVWGQHELRAVCEALRAALAEPTVPSDCTDSHQPVQEPVAWVDEGAIKWLANHPRGKITTVLEPQKSFERPMPIYTAPPQRKPLTDEEIRDLWSWAMTAEAERTATTQQHAFARAIERAHGIGDQDAQV